MERGYFEQPVLPGHERYRIIHKKELFNRAMIATEIRETIKRNQAAQQLQSQRDELGEEYNIAYQHEGKLLRMIAATGDMGEYLEHLEERHKMNSEEEAIWAS